MINPIRLYMSMSLDGYIAGPDDRPGQELGHEGGRLFNWLDDRESDGPSGQVYREAMATGAVISGRRTFELAGRWQGDHHDVVVVRVPDGVDLLVGPLDRCGEEETAGAVAGQVHHALGHR